MSRRTLTALLGLAALVGCTDSELLGSSGPPEIAPPPPPAIEVDSGDPVTPHVLQLGDVVVGDFAAGTVTIRNQGDGTLEVEAIEFATDGPWTVAPASETPVRLAYGEELGVSVRFEPASYGEYLETFTVRSNDPDQPSVAVRLVGFGGAGALDVDPLAYDFGARPVGCVEETTFTFSNVGNRDLVLSSVDLDAAYPGLVLTPPGRSTLEPGESTSAHLVWRLQEPTDYRATLQIASNDPARPWVELPLFAAGAPYVPVVDAFVQGGVSVVDVLFVVDNSGSMGDQQALLATGFPAFIDIVEEALVDYRLGVITTDEAVLQGPPVEASDPDPAATFGAQTSVGSFGSGIELALDMAWSAIGPDALNPDFLRDDAALALVIVTDEPDQSWTFTGPLAWAEALAGLRPPGMTSVSDISGGVAGCSTAWGGAFATPNFVELSALMGGYSGSICAQDWVDTLASLAWAAAGYTLTFPLSEVPVPETIEVFAGGSPVGGWTWVEDRNVVQFAPDAVPPPGSVEVHYAIPEPCSDDE